MLSYRTSCPVSDSFRAACTAAAAAAPAAAAASAPAESGVNQVVSRTEKRINGEVNGEVNDLGRRVDTVVSWANVAMCRRFIAAAGPAAAAASAPAEGGVNKVVSSSEKGVSDLSRRGDTVVSWVQVAKRRRFIAATAAALEFWGF
jgi:type IV secretory pathway VirB2 component (pilin)